MTSLFKLANKRRERAALSHLMRSAKKHPKFFIEPLESRLLLAVTLPIPAWTESGPNQITNGQLEVGAPGAADNFVIGAIQDVAVDSANNVIVGTVDGGLWRTTNGGTSWQTTTDQAASIAIGAVAFDPSDNTRAYAGVAQNSSAGDMRGDFTGGLYRSTNGGQSWGRVWAPAFKNFNVTGIVARGNLVLVSGVNNTKFNSGGVLRSTDGGNTWTKAAGVGNASDIVADPNNNMRFFAAVTFQGVYRSDDGGVTWNLMNGAGATSIDGQLTADGHPDDSPTDVVDDEEMLRGASRIRLAIQNAGGTTRVYAALLSQNDTDVPDNGKLMGIFHSNDGGQNWTIVQNQVQVLPSGNGDRFFSIFAHPTLANVIYLGGDAPGNVYHVETSMNVWTKIAGPAPAMTSNTVPHADSRSLALFTLGGTVNLIEADDGGIYRLPLNASGLPAAAPGNRWISMNGDLKITEIRSVAIDPQSNFFIGGTQDNGSIVETGTALHWNNILGGDGNTQAVAQVGNVSRRYSMANNWRTFNREDFGPSGISLGAARSVFLAAPGANTAVAANRLGGLVAADRNMGVNTFVRIPYVVNGKSGQQNRMLFGYNGLYVSSDGGDHVTKITNAGTGIVTALAYGNNVNQNVMYVARGKNVFVRTGATGAFTKFKINGADTIWDIVIDPDNASVAYAVSSKNVYRTTNAGTSWEDITGPRRTDVFRGVRSLSMNDLRTVELVKTAGTTFLLVGGMGGVFRASNVGKNTTTWSEFGGSLPNVLVTDLHYDSTRNNGTLIAGTLGRGVWRITNVNSDLRNSSILVITGTTLNDEFRLVRDFGNPTLLSVFENVGGAETLRGSFQLSTIEAIVFIGDKGNDKLIIDTTLGAIIAPGSGSGAGRTEGIQFQGGDDTDTLEIRGNPRPKLKKLDNQNYSLTGGGGVQKIRLLDVEQTPPVAATLLTELSLLDTSTLTPDELADALADLRDGLQNLSNWSIQLDDDNLLSKSIPLFGGSLGKALNGLIPPRSEEGVDDAVSPEAPPEESLAGEDTQILRRMFESGLGAFNLDDIDFDGAINSLEALRAALDGLDATAGNVSLTESNGVTRYDVRVKKTFESFADIDVDALGGNVELTGSMKFKADVTLHLVFGVDTDGFFIDAEGNLEPEFIINNFQILEDVEGEGHIGFLGVDLEDGQLTVDPAVRLNIDLHDPGSESEDGFIRPGELFGIDTNLASVELVGGPAGGANDLEFTGKFEVSAFDFGLLDLQIAFKWADIRTIEGVVITAATGAADDLLKFLNVTASEIFSGLTGVASFLQQTGAADLPGGNLLDTKIPIIDKSLQEILNSIVDPLHLTDPAKMTVSPVTAEGTFKKFTVTLIDTNPQKAGVAVGQTVQYSTAAGLKDGVIDSVGPAEFTVRFDATLTQDPNGAEFHILRPGSLQNQVNAFLGDLANPLTASFTVPTLQDLVAELAQRTGLDFLNQVQLTGSGDQLAIQFPFTIDVDPIRFSQRLSLGAGIPGLNFDSSGDFILSIDPLFRFTVGLRLAEGVPLENRFFLAENTDPEATLTIAAQLDNPLINGTLGFLNVQLAEDTSVVPNAGVTISGTVAVNLQDPGTGADDDARITLAELSPGNLVNVFAPSISAALDIDGLKITASVGTSTLGSIQISIDGTTDGKIQSIADLVALPGKIQITGEANFLDFNNISPGMIFAALQALVEQLRALGASGPLDAQLPVINKSLSELIDLGQGFADTIGQPGSDAQVATAKKLEDFINSKIAPATVAIVVTPQDIRFTFSYAVEATTTVPLAFDLGGGLGLTGDGEVGLHAHAIAHLSLGFSTAAGGEILDRVFISVADTNLDVVLVADAGYDFNRDGSVSQFTDAAGHVVSEGAPVNVTVSAGPLQFDLVDGRALVDVTASVSIPNSGGAADGKLTLSEIASANFNISATFNANAQLILPLDGSDAGRTVTLPPPTGSTDTLVEITAKFTDLSGINFDFATDPGLHTNDGTRLTQTQINALPNNTVSIFSHNLTDAIVNGFLNFGALLDGLEKFIDWGDDLLGLDVLNFKLPFVGVTVGEAFNFFSQSNGSVQFLKDTIGGSGGIGQNLSNQAVIFAAEKLRDALASVPGVLPIADVNGDMVVDDEDLLKIDFGAGNEVIGATFLLKFAPSVTLPVDLKFDLGLDFLNVHSEDAELVLNAGLQLTLGFGINKTDGFFIKTDFSDLGLTDLEELVLSVSLGARGNVALEVGLLEFLAGLDETKNYITAAFTADLSGGPDGKLTVGELLDIAGLPDRVDPKLEVEAHMDVALAVDTTSDQPNLKADFVLDWGIPDFGEPDGFKPFDVFGTVPEPDIALNNIRLDAGSFLSRIAQPLLDDIAKYNFLQPVIDVLDDQLPLIGKTPLELFLEFMPAEHRDAAQFLFNIAATISDVSSTASSAVGTTINFGSIGITHGSGAKPILTNGTDPDPTHPDAPGSGLPIIGPLLTKLAGIGITFPVLKLSNMSQLLTGNDVDLVVVDLPRISAKPEFEQEFRLFTYGIPVLLDVYVDGYVGGFIEFFADLSAGFDTTGLHRGIEHFLDGIWLGDFDPVTGKERNELGIRGEVYVGITGGGEVLGGIIASVEISGQGGIGGEIGIDFNDDNLDENGDPITGGGSSGIPIDDRTLAQRTDGKFHLDEIVKVIASNGGNVFCIFDLNGKVFVSLEGKIEVCGLVVFCDDTGFRQEWTLFDFEAHCEPKTDQADLANLVGTKLVLKVTDDSEVDPDVVSGTPSDDNVKVLLVDKDNDPLTGINLLHLPATDVVVTAGSPSFKVSSKLNGVITEYKDRGVSIGQAVFYRDAAGNPVFGFITSVGENSDGTQFFMVQMANPSAGISPTSDFTINSGKETIRVQKESIAEDFGPAELDFNFIADISTITLITDQLSQLTVNVSSIQESVLGTPINVLKSQVDFNVSVFEVGDRVTYLSDDSNAGGTIIEVNVDGNFVRIRMDDISKLPKDLDSNTAAIQHQLTVSQFAGGFGSGDDTVYIDPIITIPVDLAGGMGNDTITGGAGGGHLYGGERSLVRQLLHPFTGDDVLSFAVAPADVTNAERLARNSVLEGGDGNDELTGGPGDDLLLGGAGDDTLDGGTTVVRAGSSRFAVSGADILIGGGGNDVLDGRSGNDILVGDYDLTLFPVDTPVPFFPADEGSDLISGAEGNDKIWGDNRGTTDDADGPPPGVSQIVNDIIYGGSGNDLVFAGRGNDIVIAGSGDAVAHLASDNDLVYGGAGDDQLFGLEGEDTLVGQEGDDKIDGGPGNDAIFGGDSIIGPNASQMGHDTLLGQDGDDLLDGSDSDSVIAYGGNQSDTILGSRGADILYGDADRDFIVGGPNNDLIHGGTHDDDIVGGKGTAGGQTFPILGFADDGADRIFGDDGNDILLGDNGTIDKFTRAALTDPLGGAGIDFVFGGKGKDTIFGGGLGDKLTGDEVGLSDDDVIVGDQGAASAGRIESIVSSVIGSSGDDLISGSGGNDFVIAGDGNDLVSGDGVIPDTVIDRTLLGTLFDVNLDPDARGSDILLGDNGFINLTGGVAVLIESTNPNSGGSDTIHGDAEDDIIFGGSGGSDTTGVGGDSLFGSADDDVVIGDNARMIRNSAGIVLKIETIFPNFGGDDTIEGNTGNDTILGGYGSDDLSGNDGSDIMLGDNGLLDWRSNGAFADSSGLAAAVQAANTSLFNKFSTGIADTDLTTLDLITTTNPTLGGRDLMFGGEGKDVMFGGTNADEMHGDDGNETGSITNDDLMLGDHGRLYPQFSALTSINSRNFFAIDTGAAAGGEGDRMFGEEGNDIMLGQQGDDRMFGGLGDDDMIGGHNVAGGVDELASAGVVQAAIGASGVNDQMDGGSGNDAMTGDNAIIWRRGDDLNPRFRALSSPAIYTTTSNTITANVGAVNQSDPADAVGRDIQLVDHSFAVQSTPQGRFGNDIMVGGAGLDTMFGELGNDLMQGDGSLGAVADPGPNTKTITTTDSGVPNTGGTLYFNIPEAVTDADDYMEGNGGSDLMYGGLGQDDMIGGSSDLFGLTTPQMRPDGSDTIFGGAGIDTSRNNIGDATEDATTHVITTSATGHARDADYIMGDNATVFRLVQGGASGTNPTDAADVFRTFAYDNYGTLKIIPRAMKQLDYTLGGADYAGGTYTNGVANADNGAADLIRGESGDDFIFGMVGSDVLFGEGQDDDIIGGYGNDWISGGTGQDGVIGDDGLIFTSRNGTAEPLYGIAATTQTIISTSGQIQYAIINVTNELKKSVELVPFSYDPTWNATDDEYLDNSNNTPFADDIIFGGLGSDFLHGGSGDDAMSGAEALDHAFVPTYGAGGIPNGILDLGYAVVRVPDKINPGDVLAFNPFDPHAPTRTQAGEFDLFDEFDTRRKILLDSSGNLWKAAAQGTAFEFLLNFNEDEGVVRPGGQVTGGGRPVVYGPVRDDGRDVLFGDNGNDWLVGGTGRDDLWGGWGNDLLNADDDHTTNNNLNDAPDTHPTYEDRAYGGAGRDVLISNTGGDRLIDWVGEFNSYFVPYSPFGDPDVSRFLLPSLPEFLYTLSKADGADQSQIRDFAGGVTLRNGEPGGEAAVVLTPDVAWNDQIGAASDPQPGTIAGGARDVLWSADPTIPQGGPGQGLLTADPTSDDSAPVTAITEDQMMSIANAAIQQWSSVLEPDQRTALSTLQFALVGQLPNDALAWNVGDGLTLVDMYAAGRGWFVDSTPGDSSEFHKSSDALVAKPNSSADGRMDLLTALMHEIGHGLGYEHETEGLMEATLAAGERRLEWKIETDIVDRSLFSVAKPATANVGSGRSPRIDWEASNVDFTQLLGWGNGWTKRASGANFPEFFSYAGIDGQDRDLNIFAYKKKRWEPVADAPRAQQDLIDWHVE